MTISEIYNDYSIASSGFCNAVETHCGYDISREEIERIASKAASPNEFNNIWENADWWTDANNS